MSTVTIGLTGLTGAGKSLAASILKNKGFHVIDGDGVGHGVTARPEILEEIKKAFGGGVIRPDGSLDRRALGNIVFSDPEKLKILNSVTHPAIKEAVLREAEAVDGPVVIDGAVLKECGLTEHCDAVLRVTAPAELRKRRIMERDGLTAEEAERRISAQTCHPDGWTDVDNGGDIQTLERNLDNALNKIRGIYDKKN